MSSYRHLVCALVSLLSSIQCTVLNVYITLYVSIIYICTVGYRASHRLLNYIGLTLHPLSRVIYHLQYTAYDVLSPTLRTVLESDVKQLLHLSVSPTVIPYSAQSLLINRVR